MAYNKEKLPKLDLENYKIGKKLEFKKTSLYTHNDINRGLKKEYFKTEMNRFQLQMDVFGMRQI